MVRDRDIVVTEIVERYSMLLNVLNVMYLKGRQIRLVTGFRH